jgi:hypothetical protein
MDFYIREMRTLKIDIDSKTISQRQVNRMDWIIAFFRLDILDIKLTESRKGWHIEFIIQNPINDYEIVLLQLLLGSDWKRECFNLLRVHSGKFKNQSWNILFKKKWRIRFH